MDLLRNMLLIAILVYAIYLLVTALKNRHVADGIVAVVIIALVITTRFIGFVFVSGPSMQPNLASGDLILIARSHNIERYDIVVIQDDHRKLVKRVIGLGGERIAMKNGYTYINGELLTEPFQYITGHMTFPEMQIPSGQVFVLGDNRANSYDSRTMGPVSVERVRGKMVWRVPYVSRLTARFFK